MKLNYVEVVLNNDIGEFFGIFLFTIQIMESSESLDLIEKSFSKVLCPAPGLGEASLGILTQSVKLFGGK